MAAGKSSGRGSFSLQDILGEAVSTLGANPLTIGTSVFLLSVAPTMLLTYAFGRFREGYYGAFGFAPGLVILAGIAIFTFALSSIADGAVIQATLARAGGRRASFGECLDVGFSNALRLLGVTVLASLGMAAAAIALLVPAIILACSWSVARPAAVVERLGPTDALARSQNLTRGARWKIFALLATFGVAGFIVRSIELAVSGGALLHVAAWRTPAGYVLHALDATLMGALTRIAYALVYEALRASKEGPRTDRLEEIFA